MPGRALTGTQTEVWPPEARWLAALKTCVVACVIESSNLCGGHMIDPRVGVRAATALELARAN